MVYFRSNNFGIKDSSRENFDTIYEQKEGVFHLCSGKDGVFVVNKNYVAVIRKEEGRKKKIVKFHRDVSAIDVYEELTVCGDESGCVKVVGKMRSIVRQYHEHEARVNEVKLNGTMIISCSDDMKIKIFELSKEESVATILDNTDYVKSIAVGDGVVFSGSYDGFINGYCLTTFKKVFGYNTHRRVSRICMLGSGRVAFLSENEVCAIDVQNGGVEVGRAFHIKEATSMVFYEGRLYTASVDGNVRVFTRDLKMISKVGVRGGILSLSIFNDVLYLGIEDGGVLELARNKTEKDSPQLKDREDGIHDEIKIEIVRNRQTKLTYLEKKLNAFEYKKSMMHAVRKRDIQEVFSVMSYIYERREFVHALQDLNRRELESVLDVMIEFFTVKELVPVFSEFIGFILFLYERDIKDDGMLCKKIEILGSVIDDELCFQEQNLRSIAFLECFLR
ncbi:putative WD40 domain-containing protein [Encephalitozoon intestinalis ATCC 50506]|uniref:WD40 domain-containing protein n=1 Tax=Encephalitozoon intestinalis (strain ATCC 50506) TaxID=876142 RepID=E0S9Y3_ENCIT|nr:putative WD40 domain-containing protein [Encephalitozoon intestinalis ATCC 50506]ADM12605.1 putative WD40 domain-containing protein [Encephalitozoon intestinalis ATCC 50506]UTX46462.1 U3 small nucleolar RNA-associated protein 15 [Encephalitozoon intestinalis]